MKNHTIILLVVAGACGLVAMLGIKQYMAKQSDKDEVPTKLVLVATTPINQGLQLSEMNTEFKKIEAATCPKDAVTDLSQVKDRCLKIPRAAGDTILQSQLSEPGAFGAVIRIPPGMRVITIPVDATTTHSGMMQPGNRIDLFLTYQYREEGSRGRSKETTIPLLEYIEVFAVDNQKFGVDASSENSKARNISLLVDPDQAARITTAKKKGTISTLLRATEDTDAIKMAQFSEDDLFGTHSSINSTSSRDTGEEEDEVPQGFNLAETEDEIRARLMAELEAEREDEPRSTGPTGSVDKEEYWDIAIHESGTVRMERVSLLTETPIDQGNSKPFRSGGGLTGNSENVPELPAGASGKGSSPLDEKAIERLEDTATELLDSLF